MQIKICGIVLAAGEGRRIGTPKAFLKIDNISFLETAIKKLNDAGMDEIVVIKKEEYKIDLNNYKIKIVINPEENGSMLSSIFYGIKNHGESVDGYMIYPVDFPFVKTETLKRMLNEFIKNKYAVIIPEYENQNGHPIIIPKSIAEKIDDINLEGGLRNVIERSNAEIMKIKVDDKGVIENINYKEDLKFN